MGKTLNTFAVLLAIVAFFTPACMAMDDEMDGYDAEQQARKAHKLAASDMIYQQEEWKALYYQNLQIIELLKQMRDSMQTLNERAAKADQKS